MDKQVLRPGLSAEVELVLLLSDPALTGAGVQRASELVHAALNWPEVLGLLMVHRTAGTAWRNIADHRIRDAQGRPPLLPLSRLFRLQEVLAREHIDYDLRLIRDFDARGIRYVMLKGIALSLMGYRHTGMRLFGDDDFLFERSRLAEVAEVMRGYGYIQGMWHAEEQAVVPASRSEILLHSVTSHETFPYTLQTSDSSVLTHHMVDVHFSVDLLTNRPSDEVVGMLLDRRIPLEVPGGRLWSLHQEDMFLFLCIHFQREACNQREAEEGIDLLLYKIADLLALLEGDRYPVDVATVAERAEAYGFSREVYFALAYLDTLYPGRVPENIMDRLRPDSLSYLDEVRNSGKLVHTWKRPIVERFFDPQRNRELVEAR
jgi:Uncharacterised nucleotidyltransferase